MSYLAILLFLFLVFLFLEILFHVHLYNTRIERIVIPVFFFIIGVVWDSYAVINGHWYFDTSNLSGLTIWWLPIEEYLFFIVIPYFILTAYKVLLLKLE